MLNRFFVSLGTLAALLVFPTVSVSTARSDGMECEEVEGTLTSVADFATFTTRGTMRGSLRGRTFFQGDPLSLAGISSESSPPLNPFTSSYTGDLTLTTAKGTLTTRSVGVFEPGPFGVGTQFDTVIDGTGVFAGATGLIYYNFRANEAGDGFTSAYTGSICTLDDDD